MVTKDLVQSFEQVAEIIVDEITRLQVVLRALADINVKRSKSPRGSTKSKTVSKLRKWQGRYMSTVRYLPASQKAKVRSLRKTKGIRAAVAEAKRLRTKT